jgi:hypothetical protein
MKKPAIVVIGTIMAILLMIISLFIWGVFTSRKDDLSYTKTKPAQEDLVGVWVADNASVRWLEKQHCVMTEPPSLELKADGTFVMKNMPDCWHTLFDDVQKVTLESHAGTWKISNEYDFCYIIVMEIPVTDIRTIGSTGNKFDLCQESPPYKIRLVVGDPDSRNYIIFDRKQAL